jgi:hypothetical protein
MNGEWTFTDSRDEWAYESFSTKEEAILAARIAFDGSFFIGQLIGNDWDESLTYMVENIEEISY